jgi:CheY-like chemotaxis protein
MPVLSGVEATAKIRALQKGSKYLPIIAMTANAMKGDREKYIDAGMDDYISKPFKQDNLFNLLSKWLS